VSPPRVAQARVATAMRALADGSADFVNLRHKLHFGAPYYELLTAFQHNEPPSPVLAPYFHPDPVEARFPDGLWQPPFSEGNISDDCDKRLSWRSVLRFQRLAADDDWRTNRVWRCGLLLCTSTLADDDPFRNVYHTTNPVLYATRHWQMHFASYALILRDTRLYEEAITSSYMWRVAPGFRVGISLGLFRHHRVDRELMT
jgi:hypothetical protein